ncbi:hypothetical protein [Paenibacillus agri]|uniref:Nitroreductase domain-containing protein n=1 Tax=Paenibacillus agri TaxID=2744309 RepID=A0A850ELW2_9BACL|nr:hypothetical protein [Paenibacillus agri]NUU59121.1 hypothetical protein [Paenibacillus agri]
MNGRYNLQKSRPNLDKEWTALLYHDNSKRQSQVESLIQARMKMLRKLLTQMNVQDTSINCYFRSAAPGLQDRELQKHSYLISLIHSLTELQEQTGSYNGDNSSKTPNDNKLDSLSMFILWRNGRCGYELFYCNPVKLVAQKLKNEDLNIWSELFPSYSLQESATGAVFVTANTSSHLLGERGCRLSLLESGRLTERLSLCMHKLGWTIQLSTTFFDLPVSNLLEIDGQYEEVCSCLIIKEVG